jgi:carbon-monoxide dehydrogenase medium subunit
VSSAAGSRVLSAEDFFLGPFETMVEPGELVTEVRFPVAPAHTGHAFVEYARRHGDFAIAGAAVTLTLTGERISDASVVLCAVGPRPHRASASEQLLRGSEPSDELIGQAAQRAVDGLEPGADIHGGTEYRIRVARAQARRALTLAIQRARGGQT